MIIQLQKMLIIFDLELQNSYDIDVLQCSGLEKEE